MPERENGHLQMKTTLQRICAAALALCLALLCGCGSGEKQPEPTATPTPFDAKAYVEGGLNAVYLGRYSPEYMAMLGTTEEKCAESYERGIQVSLEVFAEYFSIELDACSEQVRQSLTELMRTLYGCAKYEVGAPVETAGGYAVEVTVHPIATVQQVAQEDYPVFTQEVARKVAAGELDRGGQNFADWWAQQLTALVSARLVAPEYLDAQTVTVTLEKNGDGAYAFSGSSLSDVDALIVTFPEAE